MPATVANALGEDGKEDSEKQLVYTRQSTMYLKLQSQNHSHQNTDTRVINIKSTESAENCYNWSVSNGYRQWDTGLPTILFCYD